MKDKEFVIEQKLRDIYYDPSTGFQSAERLYQKAKDDGLSVSRRVVKEWLKTQDTYTRHKPIVRKHKFQRTFVKDLADQIQMDLVDMGKYKNQNKGYLGYLRLLINIFPMHTRMRMTPRFIIRFGRIHRYHKMLH